jgi:hypothetical protein
MRFVAEWETGGLNEVELEIDSGPFLAAASTVTELWPPGSDTNAPPVVWTSMELNPLPEQRDR